MQRFLSDPEPEVLCIKGKWGVGKTYAWDEAVKEAVANKTLKLKKYAYVSLFGIKDSSDILQSVFALADNPYPAENEKALPKALGGHSLREMELGKKFRSLLGFTAEHATLPHVAGLGGVARALLSSFVGDIPRLIDNPNIPLANQFCCDSSRCMIRAGFLDPESRRDLIELTRDGSVEHRLARRANALVLLDDGMSCAAIAKVLFLDDDTIRIWHRLYQDEGIDGLAGFGHEGSTCRLNEAQQGKLKAWISETLPRTTREVGAWIETECGVTYESRSGLIALLHRLGMEHRKPQTVSAKLDPDKQAAFIKSYENLLSHIGDDEAVLFADAVHPTHAVRPVGCWAPKDTPVAVPQTSGRQRLNIHGAIDLETGKTRMIEAATVNAISMIMLLRAIEAMYPGKRLIHLFVDNARYHHAKLVQAWLARPGSRIKLHFIPTYCPHLDPIERLWGLMHKHVTHNRCHATFADFKAAILTFLREEVTRKWHTYCDEVSDNFRIISPKDFRVLS